MSARTDTPERAVWSDGRDDEVIGALASTAGFGAGYETESVVIEVGDIAERLHGNGPTVLRISGGLVAAINVGRRRTLLLAPDGCRVRVDTAAMTDAVLERHTAPGRDAIECLMARAAVPVGRRRDETRRALLTSSLTGQRPAGRVRKRGTPGLKPGVPSVVPQLAAQTQDTEVLT